MKSLPIEHEIRAVGLGPNIRVVLVVVHTKFCGVETLGLV
jgi:hypothetical protein